MHAALDAKIKRIVAEEQAKQAACAAAWAAHRGTLH